ncbi:uncharacterized protein G2W53_014669 [Senna tora]|uniref:Uncharacterized protein n=1 Tax=Senna tora TaxID=362788 RepID=A0A835C6T1_9FABA|nr:uncharacterized protein G2W53_014669 [Senna tora]
MRFVAMEDGEVRRSHNVATAMDSSSFFVLVSGTVHCGEQRQLFSSPRDGSARFTS